MAVFQAYSIVVNGSPKDPFFSDPSEWTLVTLQLNDVGTVVVSDRTDGVPGGSAWTLLQGVPVTILVPPANRLYAKSNNTPHVVSVCVQPTPITKALGFLEKIAAALGGSVAPQPVPTKPFYPLGGRK